MVNEQAKILSESISINHDQFITKILNEPTIINDNDNPMFMEIAGLMILFKSMEEQND